MPAYAYGYCSWLIPHAVARCVPCNMPGIQTTCSICTTHGPAIVQAAAQSSCALHSSLTMKSRSSGGKHLDKATYCIGLSGHPRCIAGNASHAALVWLDKYTQAAGQHLHLLLSNSSAQNLMMKAVQAMHAGRACTSALFNIKHKYAGHLVILLNLSAAQVGAMQFNLGRQDSAHSSRLLMTTTYVDSDPWQCAGAAQLLSWPASSGLSWK